MPSAAGSGLEPGFRGVICASFGVTGDTAGHDTGDRPRHDLRFVSANPEALADLRSVLGCSHVGVRLVLAGPPADIRAAAAAAAECGLLEEEMTLLCDEAGPRVVYCPHCRARTTVGAAGTEAECSGCATTLFIADHFSRRMGAYLGYSAHVEEAS
ncbi:dimethylamine monooxygenase subunit DmmA family protein [Paenarthrobacter sp. PH39-S1]|uniref:dimethylamine monooxygenase subunit DmmA family protein n=1 Tax=Paenarthrobacter sp. PH39-S1 TaxID=3046204 RepID=UPI0024BA1249|nr:dimethylamine monooxygenase subunit DmmA family protein [Paenarthrobacter sp. PH39-S1]MDJ0358416.1 dimethylamine monooxygenase subunit DmmA family protein [Paenarthrobacter sp. PH39-S1]